jgi:hypothetical protein
LRDAANQEPEWFEDAEKAEEANQSEDPHTPQRHDDTQGLGERGNEGNKDQVTQREDDKE